MHMVGRGLHALASPPTRRLVLSLEKIMVQGYSSGNGLTKTAADVTTKSMQNLVTQATLVDQPPVTMQNEIFALQV